MLVMIARDQLPILGAGGLLHPARKSTRVAPPSTCETVMFAAEGVNLAGWYCRTPGQRRGTVIYLHGIADNRGSGAGLVGRFTSTGFDVVAYDSRAHGDSGGDACTYGFYEKDDLRRVIDRVAHGAIVLLGTSLGAAVALQHAARDSRITGVVAAESFSDLRTVASERAPFFFTRGAIEKAFALAEQQAHFKVDEVSPVAAATAITVPVLVIHGAADADTPPVHAERLFAALAGPKRLILVPGAGHNGSLRGDVWGEIERWVETLVPR